MKYLCTGRINPERAAVSFEQIRMRLSGDGDAKVSCDASQLTVVLTYPKLDGYVSAQIAATGIADIVVGSLGFAIGCGFSVEIIQVIEEDGTAHVFGVNSNSSPPVVTDQNGDTFSRAVRLSGQNVLFRLALRDYCRAVVEVHDCATYCFRAIEGIKSAFGQQTDKENWLAMHAALGTDKATIEQIVKGFADPIRHGNWLNAAHTNSAERNAMLQLTRGILYKFLDYEDARNAISFGGSNAGIVPQ
ncbi:MAG: hypothetical protein K8U03_00245 [Planctomycetia bacterium]|nr:hypothetical protein [Planctomycetia bacterium]